MNIGNVIIPDDYVLKISDEQLIKDGKQWLLDAKNKLKRMPETGREVRRRAREDLWYFAQLVNKGYVYGDIHKQMYQWMQNYSLFGRGDDEGNNKLIMLPRAHLKSHMVATWVAWIILRHPEVTIIYLSATSALAEVQLYDVKNILGGTTVQRYFPEYLNPQEGKRDKWNNFRIAVDHPYRTSEGTRDPTVAIAGLTTNTTGWHSDIIVSDDVVVPENAYTEDGRDSVVKKTSQFTSIRNTGGFTLACGTRYHPNDIYATWKEQAYEVYSDDGELIDKRPVWEINEHKVEVDNIFIWPRAVRADGKAFGFDINSLAKVRAEYEDKVQFHAQYYNDPNDPSSDRISRDKFQYYNQRFLRKEGSKWFYNGKKLNVYAAVDFAYSITREADWSAIVVVGVDSDFNVYVLDIDRFKTNKTIKYFEKIKELHSQWHFKKIRAEVTAAQEVIVEGVKDYIKKEGMTLSVDPHRPNRHEGSKEERIAAALEHRYDSLNVWHFEGGLTPMLEDELIKARPAHDDMKDALACAVSIAVPPARSMKNSIKDFLTPATTINKRFGGVNYR